MPLPLLALLGFGGLAASYAGQGYAMNRARESREARLNEAFGQSGLPGLGGTGVAGELFAEGNSMGSAQLQAAITMLSDPRTAAAGQALLQNIFTERGQNTRQQARFGQENLNREDQQDFTAEQNAIGRAQQESQFTRQEDRLNSQFDLNFDQRERFQAQDTANAANRHAQSLIADNIHRNVPSGYEVMRVDQMGNRQLRPILGTEQWREAFDQVATTNDALTNVKELVELARTHGRKLTGPTRTRMESLRGEIISQLSQARNLGVLTPGELEFLGETGAPEITGVGSTFAASALGGYEKIFELLQQKAVIQSQIYGSLNSYGSNAPNIDFGTNIRLSESGTSKQARRVDPPPPEGAVIIENLPRGNSALNIGQRPGVF